MKRNGVAATLTVRDTTDTTDTAPGPTFLDHCRTSASALGVAVAVFLLSNPIALVPSFEDAWIWSAATLAVVTLIGLTRMRRPVVPWLIVAMLGWGALSYWWSMTPSTTRTWLLVFVVIAVMACLTEAAVSATRVAEGVALGAVALCAASLWQGRQALPILDAAWSDPTYLDGVGTHRNILSYCAVFGVAALLAIVPRRARAWVPWATAFLLLAVTVVLTKSATGLVAVPILVLITVALGRNQTVSRSPRLRFRRLVAGAGVLTLGLLLVPSLLSALGRDSSLSHRVPLWEATIEVVRARPLTGWGVATVWPHAWLPATPNPVADSITNQAGFAASHGHNSFIDALPEVGIVGVALALLCYLTALGRAFTKIASSAEAGSVDQSADHLAVRLVVLLIIALLLCGLTEPILQTPLGWFLTVLVACLAVRLPPRPARPGRRISEESR